jgi:hypothetical protein
VLLALALVAPILAGGIHGLIVVRLALLLAVAICVNVGGNLFTKK